MSKLPPRLTAVHAGRVAGFTLVEMLVSVAIVLLMMTMFAQIFQMATGSLSQQRGIAENDQRGRMVTATLRGDLERRTFRNILPIRPNADSGEQGYFEIDENDPSDDTDDVLSFTASVNFKSKNKDGSPFTGRAQALSGVVITGITNTTITFSGDYTSRIAANSRIWIAASSGPNGITNDGRYFVASTTAPSGGPTTITIDLSVPPNLVPPNLNLSVTQLGVVYLSESEPDFDDGLFGNDTAVSGAAEVCYFLRNGVLYRRVLLIRETHNGGDAQPRWATGAPLIWDSTATPPNGNYPMPGSSTRFWRDYDYAAFYFSGTLVDGTLPRIAPGVRFHSTSESLNNSSSASQLLMDRTTSPSAATLVSMSLGIPHWRFGHSPTTGLPQDGSTSGPDGIWGNTDDLPISFRRFNLQECSHSMFGYPGYIPVAGNPMNRTNLTFNYTTGLVDDYSSGGETSRRGEDILMSNVLSFDVKVWDPTNGLFVNMGNDTNAPNGPFSSTAPYANGNPAYAPAPNHIRFDTWHPLASVSGDTDPPIIPYNRGVDGQPGVAGTDDDSLNGIDDPAELGWTGSDDRPFALSAIQITINYRDISSGQIRQVTIVQSLVDPAHE